MIRVPSAARAGVAYTLRGGLYVSLTNASPSLSLLASRGPAFAMPADSGYCALPEGEAAEPAAKEVAELVDEAYGDFEVVGMGENDLGVRFAGLGDPLLRIETLLETVRLVKERRHGVGFAVSTSGLFDAGVPAALKAGGVKGVVVALNASNPPQYDKLMQPTNGKGFGDVCSFVIGAAEAGMDVTCTAVEVPGVDIAVVRALASSLGAATFKSRSFHP